MNYNRDGVIPARIFRGDPVRLVQPLGRNLMEAIEPVNNAVAVPPHSRVGIADIPRVLLSPSRVFARTEDVAAYGWPLVLLLTMVTLVGYATVETGLIDREVNRAVEVGIAELEATQADVVERSALRQMIEDQRKGGEFLRLMTRVKEIVVRPLGVLATVLLLGALLYGVVALTGRKAEWHTLLTVVVFASFVDLVGSLVRLGFMVNLRRLDVDTSLSGLALMWAPAESVGKGIVALSGLLSAVDPFRLWFWGVVIVGLTVTAQLKGWRAWATCGLCWLAAGGFRAAMATAG